MQNRTSESQYQQEDEMDLKQILLDLFDRKWFIFGLTSFVTVLGVIYALIKRLSIKQLLHLYRLLKML